ncbi:BTB/POZ domain-containing protein [Iris pallida]|uniref:BTB/POZ domain-containing protein n=1 Tax=Iris pallida TaxID=29817 RepID=A0AAX6FF65_IRIPA|nr:BTB/POZ domain-containing protein [Iris pallida]
MCRACAAKHNVFGTVFREIIISQPYLGFLELQCILEVPKNIPHWWSIHPVLCQTLLSGFDKFLERSWADGSDEIWVDDLLQLSFPVPLHCPLCQVHLVSGECRIDGWPCTQSLKQHNTKRIHIRLVGQLLPSEVLWIQIAETALNSRAHVCLLEGRGSLGEAKICDLGYEVLIKQDVGGFDVAMNDTLGCTSMEIV